MKKLLLLAVCLFAHTCAAAVAENKLAFEVHQKDYRYSTEFEFYSDEEQFGYVAKSSLRLLKHLRDTYDVYDENGKVGVESKKDMKKRGIPSPNKADAVIMCFANINSGLNIRPDALKGLF